MSPEIRSSCDVACNSLLRFSSMREYIASGGKAPRHKENGGTMEIAGCSISESETLQPAIYDLQWVLTIAVESVPISIPISISISISISTAFFELYGGDPA